VTTQNVTIGLPEDVCQRLKGMAVATQRPLEEVIFQAIRGNLPPLLIDLSPEQQGLVADLQPLSDDALWSVAREPLPMRQWQRHQRLLHEGETHALTSAERTKLEELREATDHFVIRRSYALALLKWRGYTIPVML